MFDIGFWELLLISVIGLVVIGPEKLPSTLRGVARFTRKTKLMLNSFSEELSNEIKLKEIQESIKNAQNISKLDISTDINNLGKESANATQSSITSNADTELSDVDKK